MIIKIERIIYIHIYIYIYLYEFKKGKRREVCY